MVESEFTINESLIVCSRGEESYKIRFKKKEEEKKKLFSVLNTVKVRCITAVEYADNSLWMVGGGHRRALSVLHNAVHKGFSLTVQFYNVH